MDKFFYMSGFLVAMIPLRIMWKWVEGWSIDWPYRDYRYYNRANEKINIELLNYWNRIIRFYLMFLDLELTAVMMDRIFQVTIIFVHPVGWLAFFFGPSVWISWILSLALLCTCIFVINPYGKVNIKTIPILHEGLSRI